MMFWNQTKRADETADCCNRHSRKSTFASKKIAPVLHDMKLEKVQPLVARFLGIEPDLMEQHFYPATDSHFKQIIDIRQEMISRPPSEDETYLRWRYNFSSNMPGAAVNENRIWIFTKNDVILGFVGVEASTLTVDGKDIPAIKVMDLIVKPEVDRKGLGVWMNLKLQTMGFPIIALGSNENSLGIVSKLFHRMPNQRVYKNILNSAHYFSRKLNNAFLAGTLSTIYDASFPLLLQTRVLSSGPRTELRQIERFFPYHNAALAAMQLHEQGVQFKRDCDFLNWRFFENPRDNVEVVGLWRNDQLIGYLALAFRPRDKHNPARQAFILDWGVAPGKGLQRSLAAVLIECQRKLRKEGFESISAFSYDQKSDKILRRAGLHLRSDDTKTVSIFVENNASLNTLKQTGRWFLTGADTDYA